MVAVEHAILTAIWTMAHTRAEYDEPGPDYYIRHDPERVKRHATNQLQRLGFNVTSSGSRVSLETGLCLKESSRQRDI